MERKVGTPPEVMKGVWRAAWERYSVDVETRESTSSVSSAMAGFWVSLRRVRGVSGFALVGSGSAGSVSIGMEMWYGVGLTLGYEEV